MSDAKEKARRYRKSIYWLTNRERDCGPEQIEPAYLAGHAEGVKDAMRWRDPVKEPPTEDGRYLVIGAHDLNIYNWTKEIGWYRELGWRVSPKSWRPIGPLPEVKV